MVEAIAAPYAACSVRWPTRPSGPDEKWLLTAHRSNVSWLPGDADTRKWATCGARVNTLFPSVPVERSTSAGSTALSDFGLDTSVLYARPGAR